MDEYDPPLEYQDLKQELASCGEAPWQQYKTVARYEFTKIEEMAHYPLFSSEWILGYFARLLLLERGSALDLEKGKTVIERYKTGS